MSQTALLGTAVRRPDAQEWTARVRRLPTLQHSLTTVVLVLGAVLRIRQWWFNRSLWLDELSIAGNIDQRGFLRLTHPLGNAQAAPLGWLWSERASVDLFGISERSLRLFPLLASLVGLLLFCKVAYRLLGTRIGLVALLLFATSPALIFFSAETKQYASDVTFSLGVIGLTMWLLSRTVTWQRALVWGAGATVALWFSQPSLLVTASAGLVLLWSVRRSRPQLLAVALGGAVVLVNLLVDYAFFLRSQAASSALQSDWRATFPTSLWPTTWLSWLHRQSKSVLHDPGALHRTDLALLLLTIGAVVLLRRRRATGALVVLPFAVGVAAATVHQYPLALRLALYLLPGIYLLMTAGLGLWQDGGTTLVRAGRSGVTAVVAVGLVLTAGSAAWRGFSVLWSPFDRTNGRGALAFVAAHREPGDLIITEQPWGRPNFDIYGPRFGLRLSGSFAFTPTAGACPQNPLQGLAPGRRVWVVFAHTFSGVPADRAAIYASQFERAGPIEQQWHGAGGAAAFLIQPGLPPPADAGLRKSWIPGSCLKVQPL